MPEAAGPSSLGLGQGLGLGMMAQGLQAGPSSGITLAVDGAGLPGMSGNIPGMSEGATALTLSDEPDLNIFENKSGLAEDMKFLASMPELCDVTFMVGESREPVCAVKAVLAARSK